jgi:mannose-1-phosphate guanylyltransferase
MKALLLAAGRGSRLSPLTDALPKVMVPVAGRPLLERHVTGLVAAGVRDIWINLHHLPEAITRHFGDGSAHGAGIRYSYEPEVLGTAGALKKLEPEFRDNPFLTVYGDNYLDVDWPEFIRASSARAGAGTIAVFEKSDVTGSGIVELGEGDRITRFMEKPREGEIFSRWVNAGIYFFRPEIFAFIPDGFSDFGRDVIPRLIRDGGRLYAHRLPGGVWAIDDARLLEALVEHLAGSSGAVGEGTEPVVGDPAERHRAREAR